VSGLKRRLKVTENKLEKFNQVIVHQFNAQWLSRSSCVLKTCLIAT